MNFGKLRRDPAGPVTDIADNRLFTGTIDDQRQARREYARHSRIARIINSGRVEIARNELTPIRHGMLEHETTGRWFRRFGGDVDFGLADHVTDRRRRPARERRQPPRVRGEAGPQGSTTGRTEGGRTGTVEQIKAGA